MTTTAREITERLLSAMYCPAIGNSYDNFFFGPPGTHIAFWRHAATVSYSDAKLNVAALYARRHGPPHLSDMSVGDIRTLLTTFVRENYWHLRHEVFARRFENSYGDYISENLKENLARLLAESAILRPRLGTTIYPLVAVQVTEDFDSDIFFLIRPMSLSDARLPENFHGEATLPDFFPPLADWDGARERPSAWLGVRSPSLQSSDKIRASILGALSLTLHHRIRHLFSGRYTFGGQCTLRNGWTINFGEPHVPGLLYDIVVQQSDHAWLEALAHKLTTISTEDTKKELRALDCVYRSWFLDGAERFAALFMSLDAVFGEARSATRAIVDAVRIATEAEFEERRTKDLVGLRGSVVHGGAPNVHDSEKYQRYYEVYGADPIVDLEYLATHCLRHKIFGRVLREQPGPKFDD